MDTLPKGGTITALKPQLKNKNRLSVFIDGEFAFGLDADVVAQFGLHVRQHVDAALLDEILCSEEYQRACHRAFRFLATRARSQKELEDRLARYEYPPALIARVVAKCKSLSYIDDRQFAFQYARSRVVQKPLGPELLRRELQKFGIHKALRDEAVAQVYEENSPLALALALAEKRIARLRDLPPEKARARLIGFLKRRGFDWDVVQQVLDAHREALKD